VSAGRWRWVALSVALTLWIDLGRFHAATTADTIVPVFVSIIEWTPFYWLQDRYGMLVALLATPIKTPLANLVAQSAVTIFAGLACFPLLARYFFRGDAWRAIGFATVAWIMALSDREYPAAWLSITMFYAPALALGLAGLQVVEARESGAPGRWRWAAALALMSLAHWVNFSICIALVLLFLARALGDPARELTTIPTSGWLSVRARAVVNPRLGLITAGMIVGRLVMRTVPPSWRTERYGFLAPREWLGAWTTAALRRDFGVGPWALYVLVPTAAGLLLWWWRSRARGAASPVAALAGIAAAVFYALVVEATDLAKLGNYPARYLVMSAAVIAVLGVGVAVSSIEALLTPARRRFVLPTAALVASISVVVRWGPPSWSNVEASLPSSFSKRTEDILRAKCTHLIGSYWEVWPSVFGAMSVLRRQGDDRIIWGITLRSAVVERRWRDFPESAVILCADKDHPEYVAQFVAEVGFGPVEVMDELPTILVLRTPGSFTRR